MNEQVRHIVCPHCDSTNRIPLQKPADKPKCGLCHNRRFVGRPLPLSTKTFATHIQHNDIPVVVDFLGRMVRALQGDGPDLRACRRRTGA
jgi:thioredoxin 2